MSGLTVVGICGHNRAGKDTVASVLTSSGGFVRIALADGVRELLGGLNGPSWELFKDLDAEPPGSIREAMKIAGTECREDIGARTHWTDHALMKILYLWRYHPRQSSLFVVPDIRFEHEPQELRRAVTRWGGQFFMVKVTRPGCGVTTGHSSETAIDQIPCRFEITNDGDRQSLITVTADLMRCKLLNS